MRGWSCGYGRIGSIGVGGAEYLVVALEQAEQVRGGEQDEHGGASGSARERLNRDKHRAVVGDEGNEAGLCEHEGNTHRAG